MAVQPRMALPPLPGQAPCGCCYWPHVCHLCQASVGYPCECPGREARIRCDEHRPRTVGPIETSVTADVESLGVVATQAGRRTLAAMALKLARSLDVRGDEESPSQTAKAVDTLRITMSQLMRGDDHDPDLQRRLADILGMPTAGGSAVSAEVRYPKKPRPDDVGAGGRADSDSAG